MHTIQLPNKTLQLPEYLGEFTNTQFIHFCQLMTKYLSGSLDYGTFRIRLLYKLLGMKHSRKVLTSDEYEVRNENVYRMSELINSYFIQETIDGKTHQNTDLAFVDNKIPKFKHNKTIYYGPEDALLNISFDEYIEANKHFRDFIQSKDDESLNMLAATLYRPKKKATTKNVFRNYDGDIRQEFVNSNIHIRAKELSTMPHHLKYGIYLFFWACTNYIATADDIEVEGKKVDFSVLFKQDGTVSKGIGMVGLLFSLSETKVFGNKAETGKERYWTILLRLVQNHLHAKEQKRKAKK